MESAGEVERDPPNRPQRESGVFSFTIETYEWRGGYGTLWARNKHSVSVLILTFLAGGSEGAGARYFISAHQLSQM